MSDRLFPYIPYSCALVWMVRDETYLSSVRISTSFTPAWFRERMGLEYSDQWHTDPIYRRETYVEMAKALNKEFPELRLGGANPAEIPGGLSQAYIVTLMGGLFGQHIDFHSSNWPDNRGATLTDREADEFQKPLIAEQPIFEDLMRQMDIIESEWGRIEVDLNFQGVLNTAFRLRGQEIFIDMLCEPQRAHRVLNGVCETMMELVDLLYERQACSGVTRKHFVTSNCVVNMISGKQYREFVFPYDRKLGEHYELFGVHNCGWTVDAYAEPYSELPDVLYLDFGIESDFARLKRFFPDSVLCPIFNPDDVLNKKPEELRASLEKLHDEIGRCHIILGSMAEGTPSEVVVEFYRTVSQIWNVPLEQLRPDSVDAC